MNTSDYDINKSRLTAYSGHVMKQQAYDIIGDIHARYDKLQPLLLKLGYQEQATPYHYRHPQGRKVLFLGDLIDRGQQAEAVLLTVKTMIDAGDALAIMGNHEFNAICCHTMDHRGQWLRDRAKDSSHAGTLAQFAGREEAWDQWITWMKQLPFYLDLGALRAIHACWDPTLFCTVDGKSLNDEDFLYATATKGTAEHLAIETLLKGPEQKLPEGVDFIDKTGKVRRKLRVRWWDVPTTGTLGSLAMPIPIDIPEPADPRMLAQLPNYPADAPPVFFGHYWMPAASGIGPQAPNVACLDYCAAFAGPLTAYRWDGESQLSADKMVVTE
jgi:hypothetical protein